MKTRNLFAFFLLCFMLAAQAGLAFRSPLTNVEMRRVLQRSLQQFKGTSFSGQIQLGQPELMDKALSGSSLSGSEARSQVLPFGVWSEVQHAVAQAENFNVPCSEEKVYLELCRKKLIWLHRVAAFDAQYRRRAGQSRTKSAALDRLRQEWRTLESAYFGRDAKDAGAIPENLAGPYVGVDHTCIKDKSVTVALSATDIKALDKKFGVDIDINKIRPLYNFGPTTYSFVSSDHVVLNPDKDCGQNCYYKTSVNDDKAVFESREGGAPTTTTVSWMPPPAVLDVGADIDLVAKPTAVNYVFAGRGVCERSTGSWTVDAFPAGAEMNPCRDQKDSAYAHFTERSLKSATLKYRVQPLPPNSVLRIRLSAKGHTGFPEYGGNTVVSQWLYKVDR